VAAAIKTEVGLRGSSEKRGSGGTPFPVTALIFIGVYLIKLLTELLAVKFLLLVKRVYGLGGASYLLKHALYYLGLKGT